MLGTILVVRYLSLESRKDHQDDSQHMIQPSTSYLQPK